MRTIDPILADALANQKGELILRVNTWTDATAYNAAPTVPEHVWTVKAFSIQATSASAELVTENNYIASDFSVFIIERGVKLEGIEYTIESGLFHVIGYQEDFGAIKVTGSSYPKVKISIAGDGTYQEVIEAFCAEIDKTAVFKNSGDAWLGYQFLPTGKTLSLNKAEQFENLLKQKYTILVYEESPNNLVFYTQDSYSSSALKAIASDGTNMLAVATSGANGGMTSQNGADWTPQTLPSFYNDVVYSPSLALWVAVGASVCATSPDGITWTARTIPAGTYNSITWSGTLLVAIGDNVCATSPDGSNWTARTISGKYYSIIYATFLSKYIAIGASHYTTSTDGITWNYFVWDVNWHNCTVLPTSTYSHQITKLSDGRVLVTGGIGSEYKTYFGTINDQTITWSNGTDLPAEVYSHTCTLLNDGRILVIDNDKTYFGTISGNTITWANGTDLPANRPAHTCVLLQDNRILVAGGNFGTRQKDTYFGTISGNTITWANGTDLPAIMSGHTCILLPDNRILVTGGYTASARLNTHFGTISGNTITWANGTNLPIALYSHTCNLLLNNEIIIIGGNGSANVYRGSISTNTITWADSIDLPNALYEHKTTILSDGNILVTGGYNGGGTTTIISSDIFHKIETDESILVIVGASVCATSPNASTWTSRTIPAGTYYGVNFGNSLLVAVGASVVATSPDGTTWTARTPASLHNWQDVLWMSSISLWVAVANNGASRVMFSADAITWQSTTANADFDLNYEDGPKSYLIRDQSAVHYIWRDEAATVHTLYDTTLPQWNLGYLESTDSAPETHEDAYYKIFLQKAPVRLDITDGDRIHFTPYWSIDPTKTIDAMMQVTEHLDLKKSPAWYQEIKSIILFNSTEGGALPSTIERVAAYTPLVSTGFDGNLTPSVNNLQALAQAVDDLTISGYTPPATTAANDFQVGDGSGNWITKTLAQAKTILGIFADAASDNVYYGRRNAGWTNLKTYFDTLYSTLTSMSAANATTLTNGSNADSLHIHAAGLSDGWTAISETWTRTGDHSFTVATDLTTKYRKGAFLRYKDGGAYEYGTILSSSYSAPNTTVTLIPNTSYAMAAATITDKYISYINTPDGWPVWFVFTGTVSCLGSMTWTTTTTIYNAFRPFGMNELEVKIFKLGTTGGTASNRIYSTLPTNPISPDSTGKIGVTQVNDGWTSTRVGSGYVNSTTGIEIYKADDSNFALSTNRAIIFVGSYLY